MSGFSRALAVAIVEAWMVDASMSRLSEDLLSELDEKLPGAGCYIHIMGSRSFVATFSKQANEYLWDNKFNSAKLWMMKHGAEKPDTRYRESVRRATKQVEARVLAEKTENNKFFAAHRRSEQWKVCK